MRGRQVQQGKKEHPGQGCQRILTRAHPVKQPPPASGPRQLASVPWRQAQRATHTPPPRLKPMLRAPPQKRAAPLSSIPRSLDQPLLPPYVPPSACPLVGAAVARAPPQPQPLMPPQRRHRACRAARRPRWAATAPPKSAPQAHHRPAASPQPAPCTQHPLRCCA